MKAYRGSRGLDPLVLNLGTRSRYLKNDCTETSFTRPFTMLSDIYLDNPDILPSVSKINYILYLYLFFFF